MKTRKNTTQKNIEVNKLFYTDKQLYSMLMLDKVFYFDNENNPSHRPLNYYDDITIRLPLSETKEIKVIYSEEFEFYTTIAVTNTNEQIYVTLQ